MGARLFQFVAKVRLEYLVFLLLAVISLIVYRLHYFEYMMLPFGATIGALLFIIFHRFFTNNELTLSSPRLSESKAHTLRLISSILFFVFYGLSFLALLQGYYTKTALYYVCIALCAGLIAIEILFVNTNAQGYLNLLKAFLLALNITLSNQILFPYGIGLQDSTFHIFDMVIPIVNTGHIPSGSVYSSFPGHHILVAANSIVSSADPRWLYYCLGGFVMSLGPLFVFLIGKKFVNLKFGLFAALIFTCCDFLMHNGAHPSQMTYTYFLAIVMFTIILHLYHAKDARFVIFFLVLATTMIFTHHFSAMIILIILFTMLIVEVITRIKAPDYQFKVPTLTALFAVAMFTQWIYMSNMMRQLNSLIKAYYDAITQEAATKVSMTTLFAQLPLKQLLLNDMGSGILMMLSVIGFLHFFKHISAFKRIVMAIAIALLLIVGIEVIFKESYLEAPRDYVFLQELSLVFLASCALMWMFANLRKLKLLLIILLVCLSFFSLASIIYGQETSIFKGDRAWLKLYETPYERYSAQWAEQHLPSKSILVESPGFMSPSSSISADTLPLKTLNVSSGSEIMAIDFQKLKQGNFVLFSRFDVDIGFQYTVVTPGEYYVGSSYYAKLDQGTLYPLLQNEKLYDNGMVSLYQIL